MLYVGTSWKMTKTIGDALSFVAELNAVSGWPHEVIPFVLPPHTALRSVRNALDPATGVRLGAQNAHWMPAGAYTGEISMEMVRDAGGTMVELGHSERRADFGDSDERIALKVEAALAAGLQPLVCVGEPRAVRDAGDAESFVRSQGEAALARIPRSRRAEVLLAYEPIWSIGDGGTPAQPEEIGGVIAALGELGVGAVLYGGSVDRENAAALLGTPGVGGLFVGRSAWTAHGFLRLLGIAENTVTALA